MNLRPQNMINSYSETFFREFKYLSDSRRHWREPVEEIIASRMYPRLQLLTHPFWYHEVEKSLHDTIKEILEFLNRINEEHQAMISEDFNQTITGFSSLNHYERGTMTWATRPEN